MKIIAIVTFFFKYERLSILKNTLKSLANIDSNISIFITTNTSDINLLNLINELTNININIVSFVDLINPWYLTWAHKQIMREKISDFDYFLYLEDDIEVRSENFEYWIENRKLLSPLGFYPSFVRVEFSNYLQKWVSTDNIKHISISYAPRINIHNSTKQYINLSNPYQGMFLYDKELMEEHLSSTTSEVNITVGLNSDLPQWGGGVAEYANIALDYTNVPSGFISRNIVRFYEKFKILDPNSFIHHLTNSYANNPKEQFGKIPLETLLID
jgi:hypothetical protein